MMHREHEDLVNHLLTYKYSNLHLDSMAPNTAFLKLKSIKRVELKRRENSGQICMGLRARKVCQRKSCRIISNYMTTACGQT